MIDRKHYGIIVFPSSSAASQAEMTVSKNGWTCRLIPIPEQVSAGCGLVLQLSIVDIKNVETFMLKKGVTYDGIYEVFVTKERKKTVLTWKQ